MTRRWMLAGLLLHTLLAAVPAGAVPAPPTPIELQNADGTTVPGRLFGDEHLSWAEDLAGYSLARHPDTGAWHYAELGSGGRLVATEHRAGSVDPDSLGLTPHLQPAPRVVERTLALKRTLPRAPPPAFQGDIPNLVLLVKFRNQSTRFQPSAFDPVFNGASDSVREYYSEISYGQWRMVSTVTDWITLNNDDSYYAYNDYTYGNPEQMIVEAVDYLNGQGFDFTRFDSNGDGIIDAVDVIHSGGGYENTGNANHIHSHYADLRWYGMDFTTHDGIRIVAYHTEPEVRGDGVSITQIGVICHETGHFFGLPDLYDYGYDSSGIGLWGVMCMGPWAGPGMDGTVPTHFCAWSKYKLGLLEPQHIQVTTSSVMLRPVERQTEIVRIDEDMPSSQYFLLENRQKTGYDQYLPGSGLLIFHVDDNQEDNDDQNHYLVDLEQADGRRDLNRSANDFGDSSDPYPTGGNDEFSESTTPSSKGYGQSSSKIGVTGITRSGVDITFNVLLEGTGGSLISASPNLLDFDAIEDSPAPAAKRVQVAHQGSQSLDWTAQASDAWVELSRASGSTPGSIDVSVSLAGMDPGSYSSSVRITAPGSDNGFVDVTVRLDVTEKPVPSLAASPSTRYFEGFAAGVLGPQAVDLTSTSDVLDWSIGPGSSAWVLVDHESGSTPDTLQVSVDAGSLSAGTHHGSLVVEAPGSANGSVSIAITAELTEAPGPVLEVWPTTLGYEASAGGDLPATQGVTIRNAGVGSFDWTVSSDSSWVWITPSSGNCSTTQTIIVGVDHQGLAAGWHTARIEVRAPDVAGSPGVITLDLIVEQGSGEFGESCTGPADCQSGFCVDGRCSRRCELTECPWTWHCETRSGKMLCVPGGGADSDTDIDSDADSDADSDTDSDSDADSATGDGGCECSGSGTGWPGPGAPLIAAVLLLLRSASRRSRNERTCRRGRRCRGTSRQRGS